MLRQAFALRWRDTHLAFLALGRSRILLIFLVLPVAHQPVVGKHLVENRLFLVFGQQAALEGMIKLLFIGNIDQIQRFGQLQNLVWPHVNIRFPEQAAKFG